MWKQILRTSDDWAATVLRVTLGAVMLPHGAQKLFGWFGGGGVAGTLAFFQSLGIPTALGLMAILAETAGAIALILGLGGRIAALGVGGVMIGAIATVHLPYGFFMDWSGTQGGQGFEYHLLALAMVAAIAIKGSGAWSIDRKLAGTTDAPAPSTFVRREVERKSVAA